MYNISANTIFTGKSFIYLPTCHSTNAVAESLLSEKPVLEGTLILTDEQTAGKGQPGKHWEAEKGQNLTFSIVYKPSFLAIHQQFYLTMVVSLAIRETLEEYINAPLRIKWPNDIYLNNKKISGILIQNSISKFTIATSIIGIGINVNQISFQDKKAISLKMHSSKNYSLEEVMGSVLEKLEKYYLQLKFSQFEHLKTNYLNYLYRLDEEGFFEDASGKFFGKITGIDDNGRLVVNTEKGSKNYSLQEIKFL